MDIQLTLPLDHDGFLRRECPHCVRQFKWHHGPANEEAEGQPAPAAYHCPLCGQPAGMDSWWTQEQLEYAQGTAIPAATREIEQELRDAFKGASSKHLRFDFKGGIDTPDVPAPLTEPDDMVIVTSPCHSYEPVKVPEDASGPHHCLVCGQAFAV
ncbi:hypothetical protein [Streptomyces sp. NEAU-YJ-81]|uniref:hypothetical protein n=1 Tax=Streptomyces sp. NEAU-YJ-81 TaxID=2820288 RepID=UPI001ABC3831|nr:hypothetical protein [Streptomyces sp. NEAU-YJ-81]MBO3674013.1 hypothetical protein [Streptomyces sp. NEAU-YJ-81]